MSAAEGTPTVTVTTGGSCAWTAATNAGWITIASGATGTGSGTVKLTVARNLGAARTGTASIAAQTFTVTQAAAPCGYALSPTTIDVGAGGEERRTNVTVGAGCSWTAVSNNPSWITVTAGSSGIGNGVVVFNAAANPGAARTGTIAIGGQTLTVTQQAAPCTFSISPIGAALYPRRRIRHGRRDDGSELRMACDVERHRVADNHRQFGGHGQRQRGVRRPGEMPARSGSETLTVAGQTFTVTQSHAPCTFSIAPTAQTIGAASASSSVSVTTGGWCAWTAASNQLRLAVGHRRLGGYRQRPEAMFSALANATGADRTGTITIAGITFTLTQTAQ